MAKSVLTLQKSYLLRRSFICLVFQLLFSQALFAVLFLSLSFIFQELPFLLIIILSAVNILVLMLVFLNWHFDYYVISSDAISHTKGILYKRTETYDFPSIRSVHVTQSILGMIFRYGTITLISPLLEKHVYMDKVKNPYTHAKTIDLQRLKFLEGKPLTDITPVIDSK